VGFCSYSSEKNGEKGNAMSISIKSRSIDLMNPIDQIEALLSMNDFQVMKEADDELIVKMKQAGIEYTLMFFWREELDILFFTIFSPFRVPQDRFMGFIELMNKINERVMVGQFSVTEDIGMITYRNALMTRGTSYLSEDQIQDLIEYGLEEYQRFVPAFDVMMGKNPNPTMAFDVAFFETEGEA
jgi:hypothetical protein